MVDTVELPSGIVERVLQGLPVVYPTSTLPALGCLPQSDALDSLFELKKRSTNKIVSLGVCDLKQASALVEIPEIASEMLDFFPAGSLTLILPAHETLDERLGGDAVAVRVLADARARELVSKTGPVPTRVVMNLYLIVKRLQKYSIFRYKQPFLESVWVAHQVP